jgi:subtilisin-like proprotein convertase family protein
MELNFSQRVARLARLFRHRSAPRRAGRPRFRPALEGLEERALLSTVFRAIDVPQRVDFPDVFTTSSIDVPQGLTIASVKVQLDITYPLGNDLTIDLIAPDGTDVPLSSFEGTGANFQNTVFDDAAATPIWAGNSPFAGSYRPEAPLSSLAGKNAQGTWQLEIIDWGASAGTLNSWSLIVQPVGSPAPAATSLSVGGFPSSTTAGSAGSITVTARDASGNVATGYAGTVHFTSSDPQAALPADYTFTAADAGTHTFSAALKTAGTQTLTVTDTAAGGLTGTEAGITVSPAAASRLAVSAPSAATAGGAFNVTVTARDAFGNTATGYAGTVHFASPDGQAVLPADSPLSTGTCTFSATLKTAGSESLTATDTATSSLAGSASLSVTPAAASSLLVTAPASATAGSAFPVTVTARDAYGNTVTGYTGTAHFSSSDPAAGVQLPADYTFTAPDQGRHTFPGGVTLQTAGSQTVTVTDIVTGSVTGSATVSVVAPAPATRLALSVPSGTTAGSAFSITVTALDANGNTATGYTGTVQFRSSDGQATLPASYTFTAADGGVHTFGGLVLDTAGTQTVTAADSTGSITGSGSVAVSPAAASRLVVSGFPSSATAGTAGSFAVTARDAFGNIATGYAGTVHFRSTDPQATLPANYTFTAADAGRHTFSATLKTAGRQSLAATDTVNSSLSGAEAGITVSPAAASRLKLSAAAGATAGTAFSVTVTAQDAFGNTATGYTGTVHFTSSDGRAVLPANSTLPNGTGTFSVTLVTAGSQTLTATDTTSGTLTGRATVPVSPAAANHLAFGQQPTSTAAGAPISPAVTVRVLDAYNNLLTGDNTDSVTLTLGANPGGGTLQGTTTVTVKAGIATFSNLALTKPGSGYTLAASSGSLTAATSASFTVSAPGGTVFRAADVPQRVDFPDVFTVSSVYVPQSLTIASVKVQLDITYPLGNDLTIDLIAPDGTDVPLSSFEGAGANFQNTTFDDAAATPIWAGNSPFAGSYRPEAPLSSLAGKNAQGTWQLEIIDWGASAGTLNSWSLIIQPAA